MRDATQRRLDATKYHRDIGVQLLEDLGVDDCRIFWSEVVPAIRTIGILRTQTTVGGVFIHHRVHTAWCHAKEEAGTSEFLEVAEVSVPVWLWHDGHTIACCLQRASDDSSAKGRMVDVGIGTKQDDVEFRPSPELQLLLRRWQKIRQPVLHYLFIFHYSLFIN